MLIRLLLPIPLLMSIPLHFLNYPSPHLSIPYNTIKTTFLIGLIFKSPNNKQIDRLIIKLSPLKPTTMSMIYSIVARGRQTVLASHTSFKGNFEQVATDVLRKCNMAKTFGQYGTANYNFYTYTKEGFVFLVMVDSTYETRIAVSFLKKTQQQFFKKYEPAKRNTAVAHSLKDFVPFLTTTMTDYNNPAKIDKFSSLRKELSELEEQALENMNKVIERGQKIQILVKKSQTIADQSYDMKNTAKTVRRKMWWKNKKIMIGVIIVAAALLALIIFLLS